MLQVTVTLPDDLSRWTEARAAADGYRDQAAYLRAVVERERDRQEKLARLQAAIDEGRASSISGRDPFELLAELRAKARA